MGSAALKLPRRISRALRVRVVDDLSDLHKIDPGADTVKAGDSLAQVVGEERIGGISGLPDIEVGSALLLLVEGEKLEAQARHVLEHRSGFVGHVDDPTAIEITVALERHVYADHHQLLS